MSEETSNVMAQLIKAALTESENVTDVVPTKQTIGSASGVAKCTSAMLKCAARGMRPMAQKYGQALLNTNEGGHAFNRIVRQAAMDFADTPNERHALGMLVAMMSKDFQEDYGITRILTTAIHIISSPALSRSFSNANLHNSLMIDREITADALLAITNPDGTLISPAITAKDFMTFARAPHRFDPESGYKELVFSAGLLRYLHGWRPAHDGPAGYGETIDVDWFSKSLHLGPQEALIHAAMMPLNFPMGAIKDYGGREQPGSVPATNMVFSNAPQKSSDVQPMKHKIGGDDTLEYGDTWQLIGGVPDFAFDGTTSEGTLVAQAIVNQSDFKKLFKAHPHCEQNHKVKIVRYFMALREQSQCQRATPGAEGKRFVRVQHFRFLCRYWGIAAHIDDKHSGEIVQSIDQFSTKLNDLLNQYLFSYRSMAVDKTLKL